MKRRIDWQRRLNEYLMKAQNKTFRYGRFDCCIFISDAIKAMTDIDPMEEFRGQYSSKKSAKQALKNIGSGSLYSTLRSKFGNPVHGAMGKRGDVAYNAGNAGIVNGRYALFPSEKGMVMIPITKIDKAFAVPFDG